MLGNILASINKYMMRFVTLSQKTPDNILYDWYAIEKNSALEQKPQVYGNYIYY